MQTALAGLIFLIAVSLPIYVLSRFRRQPWPLHVLAIAAALAIGFAPGTALLNTLPGTFLYGVVIFFLTIWGIGGLVGFRRAAKESAAKAG